MKKLFSTPARAVVSTLCIVGLILVIIIGAILIVLDEKEDSDERKENASINQVVTQQQQSSSDVETVQNKQAQDSQANYIAVDKIKKIAVEHAGLNVDEVTFSKAKLENDDGYVEYEIEFFKDNKEYEYTIDPTNGNILEYDSDIIGQ